MVFKGIREKEHGKRNTDITTEVLRIKNKPDLREGRDKEYHFRKARVIHKSHAYIRYEAIHVYIYMGALLVINAVHIYQHRCTL